MAIAETAAVRRLGWAIYVPAVLQHFGLGAVTLVIPRLIAQAAPDTQCLERLGDIVHP